MKSRELQLTLTDFILRVLNRWTVRNYNKIWIAFMTLFSGDLMQNSRLPELNTCVKWKILHYSDGIHYFTFFESVMT